MPNPLAHLMQLQLRGLTRRSLRGTRTLRRLAALAFGGVMFALYLAPNIFYRLPPSDPNRVRLAAPFALLGICVLTLITSAGDRAISFTPGEVDMLFPGPFTRRQLILYKLAKSTAAALLSALFLSIVLHRHASWWPACYTGIFLSLLFIQFFSINAVIAAQSLGTQLQSRLRWIILMGFLAAVTLIARNVFAESPPLNIVQMMQRISYSPLGHFLLFPFTFFGETITAQTSGQLLQWALPAATMDIVLLCLLLLMDANYLETASAASERRYAQLQRIRGGSFLSMGIKGDAHWHVRKPAFLGGIGPIVWRQITAAVRSSKGLLFLMLILALGAAPLVLGAGNQAAHFLPAFGGVALWFTLLVSTMLKFDFRGDLDLMDVLKALPLQPWAIATGQLVAPSILLAATHFALLAVAARVIPGQHAAFLCAAALVLPFDLLLFAVENLLFLLFPTRPAAASPGDFQILGRQAFILATKMIVLSVAAIPPLVVAVLVWKVTGESQPAFTIVAATCMLLEVLVLIPLIGRAFVRFDPSIHTPA
jgi:hypothetical protein